MEVSAGSSTDEPGSSPAGPFVGIDEEPIHFPPTTFDTQGLGVTAAQGQVPDYVQATDAYRHLKSRPVMGRRL